MAKTHPSGHESGGPTVHGSIDAAVQQWTIDVEHRTAEPQVIGPWQVQPRQSSIPVHQLAGDIVRQIVSGALDPRLKWSTDRVRVRIVMGQIIPEGSAPKQTVVGRRSRLGGTITPLIVWSGQQRSVPMEG